MIICNSITTSNIKSYDGTQQWNNIYNVTSNVTGKYAKYAGANYDFVTVIDDINNTKNNFLNSICFSAFTHLWFSLFADFT